MDIKVSIVPKRYFWAEPLVKLSSNEFLIANIDDLPCAYCGDKMISSDTLYKKFSKKSYEDEKKLAIDKAVEIRQYLKPFYSKALDFMLNIKESKNCKTDTEIFDYAINLANEHNKKDINQRIQELTDIIMNSGNEALIQRFEKTKKFLQKVIVKKQIVQEFKSYIRNESLLDVPKSTDSPEAELLNTFINKNLSNNGCLLGKFIKETLYKDNPECTYAKYFKDSMATIDHVKPLYAGGKSVLSNYLAVCKACNIKKSHRHIARFMNKEVKTHIENQLSILKNIIPIMIAKNILPEGYEDYVEKIKRTLKYNTGKDFIIK